MNKELITSAFEKLGPERVGRSRTLLAVTPPNNGGDK